MDLQVKSVFNKPAQLPINRDRSGSRQALTLPEVVVASFLVGTFLSLIIAIEFEGFGRSWIWRISYSDLPLWSE